MYVLKAIGASSIKGGERNKKKRRRRRWRLPRYASGGAHLYFTDLFIFLVFFVVVVSFLPFLSRIPFLNSTFIRRLFIGTVCDVGTLFFCFACLRLFFSTPSICVRPSLFGFNSHKFLLSKTKSNKKHTHTHIHTPKTKKNNKSCF